MNKLRPEKQEAILNCLVNGSSIRATERITQVHRDTIMRLATRVGANCEADMDQRMRGLSCRHLQIDEIWGFVGKKQRRLNETDDSATMGDFWTYVALDTDTRLIPSYRVGKRNMETTVEFLADLKSRLTNRVQLSSDAMSAYVDAIDRVFGTQIDYGQIVKSYEAEAIGPGRYSPPRVTSVKRSVRMGNPIEREISTSYVERSNLLMRMSIRRLTRLTDAFSKKVENLQSAIALHFWHYNFMRTHGTLKMTPAMSARVTNSFLKWDEVL